MGRVDALLKVRDETLVRAKGLSAEAQEEIRKVIEKDNAEVLQIENPTTTLEELFLSIVQESDARPGRRAHSQRDEEKSSDS